MNIAPFTKHRSATETDISQFETEITARLPDDCRDFLLQHNGGYPERPAFRGGADVVDCFFGLWQRHADLFHEELSHRRLLPTSTIPIASDGMGNCVLLEVRGPHRGRVWFWDHERARDPANAVSLLASSFTEFVNSLVPNDFR